jgi:hypothetical protein
VELAGHQHHVTVVVAADGLVDELIMVEGADLGDVPGP